MSRILKILIALTVLFMCSVVVLGVGLFVVSNGDPVNYVRVELIRLSLSGREEELQNRPSSDTTPIRFTIPVGATPRVVANQLYAQGLIRDEDLFVDYVRANNLDIEIEAGTFFLNRSQNIPEIAVAITDTRNSQFAFRILEGWRMEEIANVIDQNPYFGFSGQDFLAVVGAGAQIEQGFIDYVGLPAGASLEGFLFPDTYQLPADVTPVQLRSILLNTFMENVGSDLYTQALQQGFTLREMVALGSIIQREAVHADEHTMISSAYRNRLAIGMNLDADPTVQYGIGFENGSWWPQITQADYREAISPYNTYINAGLPPGPIASPGISAIRAAINPESTDFYYFRADCSGNGYHNFARTFEEHLANGCS